MSIQTRSGLVQAVSYVQTFLTSKGLTAKCELGWKRRDRQLNQGSPLGANRVLFIPSDSGGKGGTIVPARFPGPRNVRDPGAADAVVGSIRSLHDWQRRVTVSVWGVDAENRTDEAKQIEATETLLEWVVRAVHSAPGAFAEAAFGEVTWSEPPDRSFGLELIVGLTFKQPLFDEPRELVFPDAARVSRAPYVPPTVPDGSAGDT